MAGLQFEATAIEAMIKEVGSSYGMFRTIIKMEAIGGLNCS